MGDDIVTRNIAAVRAAYDYIRGDKEPAFDKLDGGARTLAFASAMVAEKPLRDALAEITAMETPYANATVKRMASRAKAALEAAQHG